MIGIDPLFNVMLLFKVRGAEQTTQWPVTDDPTIRVTGNRSGVSTYKKGSCEIYKLVALAQCQRIAMARMDCHIKAKLPITGYTSHSPQQIINIDIPNWSAQTVHNWLSSHHERPRRICGFDRCQLRQSFTRVHDGCHLSRQCLKRKSRDECSLINMTWSSQCLAPRPCADSAERLIAPVYPSSH